jgi:hemoglobin
MKNLTRTIAILTINLIVTLSLVQAGENSLFDRLGGKAAITAVVSQFVDYNSSDKIIGKRWNPDNTENLKLYLTELVCNATGGDCIYTGQPMDVAHAGLKITDDEFNRVAANLVKALDKFKVPEKEKGELLTIIGSLKDQVVGQ